MANRTGGRAIVDALRINGVDTVFCVPGESYIAVLDALYDTPDVRVISCRHEAAAANMAEAYGKLTGRPGIAFVTRAPGATHASIGVHIARQDSTPMILFVGQVARGMQGREAFQEIDYAQVFGGLAKWASEIDDARRVPELVTRAFHVAMSGRPGPVVLAMPEDMLRDEIDVADLGYVTRTAAHPGADELERLRTMLAESERPLVILGGSGWDQDCMRGDRAFRRTQRVAGGVLVSAAVALRQPQPALCRRSRHRAEPRACRSRPFRGPAARGRRAVERGADGRLHADRVTASAPAPRARVRRSRRARARVSTGARDQRRSGGVRARARRRRANRFAAVARAHRYGAPRLRSGAGSRRTA